MFNFDNHKRVTSLSSCKVDGSVPIILVSSAELDGWKEELSASDQSWIDAHDFKATKGRVLIFGSDGGKARMVAAGIGDGEITPWDFAKISMSLPDGNYHFDTDLSAEDANSAAFGWAMAHYAFDYYQKEKKEKKAELAVSENCNLPLVMSIANGTYLTRDLVNTPTCDMGPTELAAVCEKLAAKHEAEIEITVGNELLKKGYETIHTVGRAAEKEPRLIDITWGNSDAPKVTLVGKGVCFDTGGLDIKPSSAMLTMKKDMGGAAHVLGLGQMIMENKLDIRLRILIPAVENNIAGNAFRPGDIIKSYHGTTIEVGNTDAEGRLVLCDALAMASEEDPDIMLDFATLTGAARVAMGADVPPFFTDDDDLAHEFMTHSDAEHDPLWPLPLYKPYKKLISSTVADLNNVASTGFGGAITAALFLQHFVGKDIPWAHFDVYAWNSGSSAGRPKGGEAMGLRAVYAYLADKYGS